MFESEKREIIETGKKLDRYGLISLSGGNISTRLSTGEILITPSGMIYEDMMESDVVVMDIDGRIIEGNRRPSVDNEPIRYIFQNKPEVNAVIHTHQPYATGIGLVIDEIPCNLTTLANSTRGSVKVAPYSSAADIEMGIQSVKYLDNKLAVVLKHHGVVTVGENLNQALYAAVYLEEACKTIVAAKSYSGEKEMAMLDDSQVETAIEIFKNYGQK
ncbi:class II aldolase/adducin family protein [Ruoffia tabacinasalis]|uniref:Class II aldolase/adducin family protein n=1 Tax=Ruoffia tabacinasalis TaxID=87458 RepID=A0A5R9DTQ4_9LACT|nr:class II aldolase/adducin family protein [Ruoffia tabacinasalis]TLQ39072.1 class II aldolase/adducin family protein [Ruoffia tabacinasalis]